MARMADFAGSSDDANLHLADKATLIRRLRRLAAQRRPEALSTIAWAKLPATLLNDLDVARAVADLSPHILRFFSDRVRDDDSLAERAVSVDPLALGLFSDRIRENRDLFMLAAIADMNAVRFGSDALRGDVFMARAVVRRNPEAFAAFSSAVRSSTELAMAAIQRHPANLAACSDGLRNDPRIVELAVRLDPLMLVHASPHLWLDKQFIERNFPQVLPTAKKVLGNLVAMFGDEAASQRLCNPHVAALVAKRGGLLANLPPKTHGVIQAADAAARRPQLAPGPTVH